jgi:hypothetical protein
MRIKLVKDNKKVYKSVIASLFITFSVVDFALRWRKRFTSDAFEDVKTISAGFYFTGLETRK